MGHETPRDPGPPDEEDVERVLRFARAWLNEWGEVMSGCTNVRQRAEYQAAWSSYNRTAGFFRVVVGRTRPPSPPAPPRRR